jgi:c-di-GMP-binding flagellar brake protein YcgR
MGEVVRSEVDKQRGKYTYGIKFIEVSESAKNSLDGFLKRHLPEQQPVY